MNTVNRRSQESNWMHKCGRCKNVVRVTWTQTWTQGAKTFYNPSAKYDRNWTTADNVKVAPVVCFQDNAPSLQCPCGLKMFGKRVLGRVSEHECDARCTGARGHVCECSCGGKNHGSAFMPVLELSGN